MNYGYSTLRGDLYKSVKDVNKSVDDKIYRFSLIKVLKNGNKINNNFLIMLDKISLEDIIALKLELSFRNMNNKLINFGFIGSLPRMIEESIVKFAYSVSNSKAEFAYLLNLKNVQFVSKIMKRFNIRTMEKKK